MASPKPHPDPPAAFNTIDLPIVRRFRQWFRVHGCHLDPLFFGMTRDWRYDDPEGEFGILYLSRHNPSLVCAAIYDRASFSTFEALGSFLGPRLINDTARLLDKYGVGLS